MYVHIATNFDILDMIYGGLVENKLDWGVYHMTYPHHRTKTTATVIRMQSLSVAIKQYQTWQYKTQITRTSFNKCIGHWQFPYPLLTIGRLYKSPFVVGYITICCWWSPHYYSLEGNMQKMIVARKREAWQRHRTPMGSSAQSESNCFVHRLDCRRCRRETWTWRVLKAPKMRVS